MQPYRRKMQYIFQDPYASLNPRMTVGDIVGEPIDIHNLVQRQSRAQVSASICCSIRSASTANRRRVIRTSFRAGSGSASALRVRLRSNRSLSSATSRSPRWTCRFRRRLSTCSKNCSRTWGLTYLFIAHDLAVVKHISQRIGVMYLGKNRRAGGNKRAACQPIASVYARAALRDSRAFDPQVNRARKRIILEGEIPNPLTPPKGCVFSTRCPYAKEVCHEQSPALMRDQPGHQAACHFAGNI